MSPPSTFAERLKLVMVEGGLTQIDLARMIGVTQSAVSLWLRDTEPSRRRIDTIAIHLALDENWLRTGQGQKELSPEARQARDRAKADQVQTVQRLVGELHARTREVIVRDPRVGIDKVFLFDGATNEQWSLIMGQIEASHQMVSSQGGGSHPTA